MCNKLVINTLTTKKGLQIRNTQFSTPLLQLNYPFWTVHPDLCKPLLDGNFIIFDHFINISQKYYIILSVQGIKKNNNDMM